jgi:LmbE family N-acetylglucosaminyl deacetylase
MTALLFAPHNDDETAFAGLLEPDVVLAPAVEDGGHEQHRKVGQLAAKVFLGARLVPYLTYRRGHGRTVGHPVLFTPDQLSRKLRALACYRSQMTVETGCVDWFVGGQQEYTP